MNIRKVIKRVAIPVAYGVAGVFLHRYSEQYIENEWVRLGIYGVACLFGVSVPAALYVMQKVDGAPPQYSS